MLMTAGESPATLIYGPNGFRVVKPGRFVVCAVSQEPIALQDLRYWSVDRQEPYGSPDLATQALLPRT